MNGDRMPPESVSRRSFLRTGCMGAVAVGVTVCSGAGLVVALRADPPPLDLPSSSYGEQAGDKVLIAYASATGSTVDIAAAVGSTLGERGFSIDVRPVKEKPSIDGHQAVLVGSAVQGGNWLPEAVDFVQANQSDLNLLPVALFSVHFFNRGTGENAQKRRLAYLDKVRPLVPLADIVFFAGRFDQRTTAVGLPSWLARLTPTMDFRDWEVIRAWAHTVFA